MGYYSSEGNLKMMKWIYTLGAPDKSPDIMTFAAIKGHVDIVEWLHQHDYKCDALTMNWASMNGHFDVMKYLHDHKVKGFVVDRGTFIMPSIKYPDIHQWLVEHYPTINL